MTNTEELDAIAEKAEERARNLVFDYLAQAPDISGHKQTIGIILKQQELILKLQDFAIWMTGFYPFADLEYFVKNRHLLTESPLPIRTIPTEEDNFNNNR